MTKEQKDFFKNRKLNFVFTETEELRNYDISTLDMKEGYNKALRACGMHTVGAVIDNWDNLDKLPNMGVTKVKNVRAAIFALICEMNLLKDSKLKFVV